MANDGTYLGTLTSDKYAADSICNKYGNHGSKYAAESIWNEYGNYGGKYSVQSPFNPYTLHAPTIVIGNQVWGHLTVNENLAGNRMSPLAVCERLKNAGL